MGRMPGYKNGKKGDSERRPYVETIEDEMKDEILFIREERERYTKHFEEETEKFIRKLEAIEKRCLDAQQNPEDILDAVSVAFTNMSYTYEEFEKGVNDDKAIIKDAQVKFREKTNPIMSKSYCVNRTRTWPQGYQGDFGTLEEIYRNMPMSVGIGYYLDKCMLSSTLAVAVRERIIKLRELLKIELMNRRNPRVLDIACGSCREVFELVPEIEKSGAKFTCIDLDSNALNFALNRLSYANLSSDQIEFLKYNALRMFDHDLNMKEFGMQDIIYSVGYFDYLPDDFLSRMLKALYQLLNKGGKLIGAFKDADCYRYYDYHWLVDWNGFLQRTEYDFDRLFEKAGIPRHKISITREKTGVIIFYTATK